MSTSLSNNFHTLPRGVLHPDLLKQLEQERCSICLDNFQVTHSGPIVYHYMKEGRPMFRVTDSRPIVYHYMKDGKPMCPHHAECFQAWAQNCPTCPNDRAPITSIDGIPISEAGRLRAFVETGLALTISTIGGLIMFALSRNALYSYTVRN